MRRMMKRCLKEHKLGRVAFGSPVCGQVCFQAALPATIRWVVEVWTSNVRILGSVSSKCFSISWILGYCSWW